MLVLFFKNAKASFREQKLQGILSKLSDYPPAALNKNHRIHDKEDSRRGGDMYLPTMKVRASLRMKGMSE